MCYNLTTNKLFARMPKSPENMEPINLFAEAPEETEAADRHDLKKIAEQPEEGEPQLSQAWREEIADVGAQAAVLLKEIQESGASKQAGTPTQVETNVPPVLSVETPAEAVVAAPEVAPTGEAPAEPVSESAPEVTPTAEAIDTLPPVAAVAEQPAAAAPTAMSATTLERLSRVQSEELAGPVTGRGVRPEQAPEVAPTPQASAATPRQSRWGKFTGALKGWFRKTSEREVAAETARALDAIQGPANERVFGDQRLKTVGGGRAATYSEQHRASQDFVRTTLETREEQAADLFEQLRTRVMAFERSDARLQLLKLIESTETTAKKLGNREQRAAVVRQRIDDMEKKGLVVKAAGAAEEEPEPESDKAA